MDQGYLSQKAALPVMQLSYGGSYSQHSSIQYILGPLVCRGKFPSEMNSKLSLSFSGKAKPYQSEKEKVAQDEIKSKINEIEAAISDGDHTLDEKIKTVRLNLESVKNGMTDQMEQVQVSQKIIDRVEILL